MKMLHTVLVALAAVLTLTAAAEATVELWTPPLLVAGGEDVDCQLLNTATRPITVEVTLYSASGGALFDSGPVTLGPKAFVSVGRFFAGGDSAACNFAVPSKTMVRASSQTEGITNVAVPAQ